MATTALSLAAGATALYNGLKLIKPTIYGNNHLTREGPYNSCSKRLKMAARAALTGASALYVAPFAIEALAGASAFKTSVAIATLALNAPSIIRNIHKGDEVQKEAQGAQKMVGPYSTLVGRALGHAQEAATGAAIAYLTFNNPEITYTIASTAISTVYETTKFAASSACLATYEVAKIAVYATGSLLSAGLNAFFGKAEGEL